MSWKSTVVLVNPLGLHARAAGKIVKLAGRTSARVEINRPSKGLSADARSILELLSLGAKNGSTLLIRSSESDGEPIVDEIVKLIESGFGEL